MKRIFEIRSIARDAKKMHYWGARYSKEEAQNLLDQLTTGDKKNWANKYHEKWWIEEIDTTGMFTIPPSPTPRDLFKVETKTNKSISGKSDDLHIEILNKSGKKVAEYKRNHRGLYDTFEVFRQGEKYLALVSPDYTATSVMDLATGRIIASEKPDENGFCPVGFYVPDWWDVNDESILPGSNSWTKSHELPNGSFGFVWGCIWGDDSSWKIQYLDLSQVQKGKILREERFGYLELANHPKLHPKDFIDCFIENDKFKVRFSIQAKFDLDTGIREVHELE